MIKPVDQNSNQGTESRSVELSDKLFSAHGYLHSKLQLEHRPEQEQMAAAVSRSFVSDAPLVFEAGTGVGKTLAYLIPGIIHAWDSRRKLIVSTHTISLQEQIKQKDLELCRSLFETIPELSDFKNFKTALLVGRGNYLCPPRLAQAIITKTDLFHSEEQQELERISDWSMTTETGLVEELNPPPNPEVWDWVNADSSLSNPRTPECFYQKARAKIQDAHVVIVNHALLFSLISAGAAPEGDTPGVLFPSDFAVIDEAHCIPSAAAEYFGLKLSSGGLENCLNKLYNPKRKKGLLKLYGTHYDCEALLQVQAAAEYFFNSILCDHLKNKDIIRLHQENWIDSEVLPPLKALTERIGSLAERVDSDQARDELRDQRKRLLAYYNGISNCISLAEDDHVYWAEKTGRKKQIVHLNAVPLDTAPYLARALFERNTSAVLTSATMAVDNSMEKFNDMSGAWSVENEIVHSPFDYENAVQIYIARDMPVPNPKNAALDIEFLVGNILNCHRICEGGTLVLFTSYQDMNKVAEKVREADRELMNRLLVQGTDFSRSEMVERFKKDGSGLMFGTDSFWTGIDIPGAALSQLIITRLPFENPKHPLMEAKSEWLQERGLNPFADLALPNAIIKFRQGIGRLIRKKSDCGIITILDSRIINKEYGRHFLNALPKSSYTTFDKSNRDKVF